MTSRSAQSRSVPLLTLGAALALLLGGCGLLTTPQQVLARANRNLAAHDYRAAAVDLSNLIAKQPNDHNLRMKLAEAQLRTGAYLQSAASYRKAQQLGAPWSSVAAGLAEALIDEGKPQQALDLLAAHAPSATPDALTLTLRGRALLALDKLDDAHATLTQAIALSSADTDARVALAEVLERQGDPAAAKAMLDAAIASAPADFSAHLALATWYLGGRQIAPAHAQLLQALQLAVAGIRAGSEPWFDEYRTLVPLANTELMLGDLPSAKKRLARLSKLAPHQPATLLVEARIDLGEKRTEDARTALEELLSRDPQNVPAKVLLGLADARAGQLSQAEMYLNAGLAAAPGDLAARKLLAEVQLAEGKPSDALHTATNSDATPDADLFALAGQASALSGDLGDAVGYLERSTANAPQNKVHALELAAAYIRDNKSADALDVLKNLKVPDALAAPRESLLIRALLNTATPADVQSEANRFAAAHSADQTSLLLAAQALLATRDVTGARRLLQQATRLEPPAPQPWIALGELEATQGNRAAAGAALDRALQIDPRNVIALVDEIRLALVNGNLSGAEKLMVRLRATKAPQPLLQSLQGDLALRGGKLADALRDYTSAASIAPSSVLAIKMTSVRYQLHDSDPTAPLEDWLKRFPHDTRTRLVLAQFLQTTGHSSAAAEAYEAVLADAPNELIALNNLAWLRLTGGETAAGLALARRAYAIAPSQPSVADTLGWGLVQSGKPADAVTILRSAHDAAPHDAEIQLHLATALLKADDRPAARRELQEIVASEPQAPQAQQARSMLTGLGSAQF